MLNLISDLFGSYTPLSYTVGEDVIIPDGLAGVDIPYVLGGVIFCIMLSGIIGIIKVVLNKI